MGRVGMQLGRVFRQCLEDIVHHRQIVVFDLDQVARGGGDRFRLGHHDRDLVGKTTHDIRAFLGAARPA